MSIFEITSGDIAQLNDTDLRSLIGRLCEAELRSTSDPTSSVRWGGDQNAPDGGLDVEVALTNSPQAPDFIQRQHVGLQVKKPSMARAAIIAEMRPEGTLRPIIHQLIEEHGSYIIVSSGANCSPSMLTNRLHAMREAVANEDTDNHLHLDFYDRSRIATWVRNHPSIVLWVRQKTGCQISGWRPYGNWAGGAEGDAYLLDEHTCFYDDRNPQGNGLKATEGINRLRECLVTPKTATRLAGLSGVGKTRLVQALFEREVAENPLDRSLAVYADIGSDPKPSVREMTESLIAKQQRAILIIDNCPPEVHQDLVKLIKTNGCQISLLTVEYDVNDGEAEDTNIFRLEPSDKRLIERLVQLRYPHIGQVDARTIAEFSGGNSRIALALARTVERGDSLTNFNDTHLFHRLFRQRRGEDQSLLRAAEALSIVYSFDGESTQDTTTELSILGELIDNNALGMFHAVAELHRRQLVQHRGKWRAVLPHAIANRLAKQALQNIPRDLILNTFNQSGRERLLKSFSRRLGYLHDSLEAIDIARVWFSDDGLLGRVSQLNALGIEILTNVAPVIPELMLEAINRSAQSENGDEFTSHENNHEAALTRLLRKIAYDPELFEASVNLLIRFARSECQSGKFDSIQNSLNKFFQLYLSGTHATTETRARIVSALVTSVDSVDRQIGFGFLGSALKAWHFRAIGDFDFGAHHRDHGYIPKCEADTHAWYSQFLAIAAELVVSTNSEIAASSRKLLATSFRELWTRAGMYDELEEIVSDIRSDGIWIDGWLNVRKTITYDSSSFTSEVLEQLNRIADVLSPTDLYETACTYAFSNAYEMGDCEPEDTEEPERPYIRSKQRAEQLGIEVATHPDILNSMLSRLFTEQGDNSLEFGKGLAQGATDRTSMWNALTGALEVSPSEHRNYAVLCGFIEGTSAVSPDLVETWLNMAIATPYLRACFVFLQCHIEIGSSGHQRLLRLIDYEDAPIWQFQSLAYGRAHKSLSDDDLATLLYALIEQEHGIEITLEILSMRFHGVKPDEHTFTDNLIAVGRDILACTIKLENSDHSGSRDYKVSRLIDFCLRYPASNDQISAFFHDFSEGLITGVLDTFEYSRTLKKAAKLCPHAFLDAFLLNDAIPDYRRARIFSDHLNRGENPLSEISSSDIITWCQEDPAQRFPLIASEISPFEKVSSDNDENEDYHELTAIAVQIMNESQEPSAVIDEYVEACCPMSCSGSRAEIIARGRHALEKLLDHENPEIHLSIQNAITTLRNTEESERQSEAESDRTHEQRFE